MSDFASEVRLEAMRGSIAIGQHVMRSLEWANGGAIVAILTFYGNAMKDGTTTRAGIGELQTGLMAFAAGLALVLAAAGFGYLGQLGLARRYDALTRTGAAGDPSPPGPAEASAWLIGAATACSFSSLVAFVVGVFFAGHSFELAAASAAACAAH